MELILLIAGCCKGLAYIFKAQTCVARQYLKEVITSVSLCYAFPNFDWGFKKVSEEVSTTM